MTRVLIIEDEESYREATAFMLRKEGFEVTTAANGADGLEAYSRNGADIVLLDLMLPELPGTEVCRRIRAESGVPIVMLTARTDTVDVVVPPRQTTDQREGLAYGQVRGEPALLEHDPHPTTQGAVARVLPEDPHGAGGRGPVTLHDLDGGGLPGTVGAEQAEELPTSDLEIDPVDGSEVPVVDPEVVDLDDRLRAGVDGDGGREKRRVLHVPHTTNRDPPPTVRSRHCAA